MLSANVGFVEEVGSREGGRAELGVRLLPLMPAAAAAFSHASKQSYWKFVFAHCVIAAIGF